MAENNISKAIKIPTYPPSSDFPSDALRWMKYNATLYPRRALKLMQTHKYFIYNEFPYTCIQHLVSPVADDNDEWFIKRLNSEWESDITLDDLPNNIWLTDSLMAFKPNFIPQLFSKIAVYDIKELSLSRQIDYHTFCFSDFKVLASNSLNSIRRLYIERVLIVGEDSKTVPLDEKPELYVRLKFEDLLSVDYCKQLQSFVDKIVEAGITEYFPPRLDFPGLTDESSAALKELRHAYKKKLLLKSPK
uniref:Uncharacterized protein n=1 Tax=Panagrolaimus sp. ES5 TaxID=591445 RepID=A0AC34GAW9_9BILA